MTSFDSIIDMALTTVDDYKLRKLYEQSEENFLMFCDGLLIRATPNFNQCRQSLEYNSANREFVSDLSVSEISILADLWVIEWMSRQVQDSSQFQLKLKSNNNFTFNSEAQNLKEKTSWLDRLRERVQQKMNLYLLEDIANFTF